MESWIYKNIQVESFRNSHKRHGQCIQQAFQPPSCIHRSAKQLSSAIWNLRPSRHAYHHNFLADSLAISSLFRRPSWSTTSHAWCTSWWSGLARWYSGASPPNPSSCSSLGSSLAGLIAGPKRSQPLYIQAPVQLVTHLKVGFLKSSCKAGCGS